MFFLPVNIVYHLIEVGLRIRECAEALLPVEPSSNRLLKKEASTEVDAFQSAKPFGFCRKTSRPIYRMA